LGAGAANNVDAYTGIKNAITARDPDAQVDFLPGVTGGTTAASLNTVDAATIAAVKNYDAVIVVAGTDFTTAREDMDRTNLALPGAQASMISQVEAANPKTVVYLETVGAVETGSFEASTPSLLWSSYNGQRQGVALANVLLGTVNPSGHLPFTWYRDSSQLAPITDYTIRPSATNPGRTYQYFTGSASYPFGYGDTYARFSYAHIKVARKSVDAEGTITATARVTNRSNVAGAAVPQLYVTTPFEPASAQRPAKRLEAFSKVTLQPGKTTKVTFRIPVAKLAFLDEASNKFVVDNGTYGLELATSAADSDVHATATVRVTGSLGSVPTVVTAKPVEAGDPAADVAQRVYFDRDTTIDPQLTVATDDQMLHGYISKGESTALPPRLTVRYSSNRPKIVAVTHGTLRTVGSGIATVSVAATYRGHTVRTSFVVDVAPLQITSSSTATATVGTPVSIPVTTQTTQSPTPGEIPRLTLIGVLPDGLHFVDNGDGTATISGTPTSAGTFGVTIRARNRTSPVAVETLTITVNPST
jgi:beta-glucosidase